MSIVVAFGPNCKGSIGVLVVKFSFLVKNFHLTLFPIFSGPGMYLK
jgi:hypothetical protein